MILSKRQLSLFRGNGGGLSPLQAALAQFGFWAPLETSVALYRGYGAASFTRATTATVKDWEGAVRNCLSGEVRFAGQRRVHNRITGSSSDWTSGTHPSDLNVTTTATTFAFTAAGNSRTNKSMTGSETFPTTWVFRVLLSCSVSRTVCIRFSGTGGDTRINVAVDSTPRIFSAAVSLTTSTPNLQFTNVAAEGASDTTTDGVFTVGQVQVELATGQSNQNPSEYVSVGAAKSNLLIYTEEIDNGAWTKVRSSITANTVANPLNGAVNAEKIVEDGSAANTHYIQQLIAVATGVTYTLSVYVKAAGRNYFGIQDGSGRLNSATAYFDLALGEVDAVFNGATNAIEAVGNGWYRCSMTATAISSGNTNFLVLLCNTAENASYNGDSSSGVYIYGTQAEAASTPGTYFPVGSVYPYHGACVDGVRYFDTLNGNTVASNVVTEATGPAITRSSINEYGYLAESARTNLVLQSSNLGTTWTTGGTPTRSAAAAYCGEIALDLIGDDTAAAAEYYAQTITFTGDATKSISFLVKQGTSTSSAVRLYDSSAPAERLVMVITWSGGVPVCTYTTGSAERASEYMGNGVWRIFCLTASVTAANTNGLRFYPASDSAFGNSGTGDIYIGGVQAENATYASGSHIPTTTATVTRNADQLTYPAAGNVSGAVGTCYVEAYVYKNTETTQIFIASSGYLVYKDNGANNAIGLYDETAGRWAAIGGAFEGALAKCATQWNTTSALVAKDGTVSASLSFDGNVGLTSAVELGVEMGSILRSLHIATVALTDAELQLITQ